MLKIKRVYAWNKKKKKLSVEQKTSISIQRENKIFSYPTDRYFYLF